MRRSSDAIPQMRRPLLIAYVGTVCALTLLIIGESAGQQVVVGRDDLLRAGVLLLLFWSANWQPRHSRPNAKITLDDVPLMATALLLPLPLAVFVVLVGEVPGQFYARFQTEKTGRPQPWFVMVFNVAYPVVQIWVGVTIFAMFRPDVPLDVDSLGRYLGVMVAVALAMYVANVLLLAGAVGLQRRVNPFSNWWGRNWRTFIDRATLFALGMLGATLGASRWWGLLPVALPMASMFVSFENAARAYLWQEAATHDPLTALYNRLYFFERFAQERRRTVGRGEPCGLILADLDGLKERNDTYGHLAGDQAIVRAAEFLREYTRSKDVVARIGGDEFAVLLPQTTLENTACVAARMRSALPIRGQTDAHPPLVMSFGIAPLTRNGEAVPTIEDVLQVADAALYVEKVLHHSARQE